MNDSQTRTGPGDVGPDEDSYSNFHTPTDAVDDTPRVDGRVLRGRRNRQAIIDAYRELFEELSDRPRATDVAARAGVSVRSLFQHFRDLDELRAAVVEELCRQALGILLVDHDLADPALPLLERVDRTLSVRVQLWELLVPPSRGDLFLDQANMPGAAGDMTQQLAAALREHLRIAFEAELTALPLDFELALSLLQMAVGALNWFHFRRAFNYDVDTTVVLMRHMALALLQTQVPSTDD